MASVAVDQPQNSPCVLERPSSNTSEPAPLLSVLTVHFNLLNVAHEQTDRRMPMRVLTHLSSTRHLLSSSEESTSLLSTLVSKSSILNSLPELSPSHQNVIENSLSTMISTVPECQIYLSLLVVLYLLDQGNNANAFGIAKEYALTGIQLAKDVNLRTTDPLTARLYFHLTRCYELSGTADQTGLVELQNLLMLGWRTAELRAEHDTATCIHNCLLRLYTTSGSGWWEAADKLLTKTVDWCKEVMEKRASANQLARHHFYVGKLRAVQGHYGEALDSLQAALRRGPQIVDTSSSSGFTGVGFVQSVTKFLVVVHLLMGDVPERSIFKPTYLAKPLLPYLVLSNAVRLGDLQAFASCLESHQARFIQDQTICLISRLHQNVLRAALKRLCFAYRRISFEGVKNKLGLSSTGEAQSVLLKAIQDGVLERVTLDLNQGYLVSAPLIDDSPAHQDHLMHQRIKQCQQLRQSALQAMRFSATMKRKRGEGKATQEVGAPGPKLLDDVHDDNEDPDHYDEDGGDLMDEDMGF